MPDNSEKSKRDLVLAKVMERFSSQISDQGGKLDELNKNQMEIVSAVKSVELHHDVKFNDADNALEHLRQDLNRYRSDMLGIVGEQDRLNKYTKDLAKQQASIAEAQEKMLRALNDLESRYKIQEKTASEIYSHSLEQAEKLSRRINDSDKSVTKLLYETEKTLVEKLAQTEKQADKTRHDIFTRLRTLDGIENSLATILVRTEPPEKKPAWPKRAFRKIHWFFTVKLRQNFRKGGKVD